MAPFYQNVCEDLKWSVDDGLLQSMKKANQEELQKLEDAVKDAKENLGESEVREAMLKRANHYARIGDKVSENVLSFRSCEPNAMLTNRIMQWNNSDLRRKQQLDQDKDWTLFSPKSELVS